MPEYQRYKTTALEPLTWKQHYRHSIQLPAIYVQRSVMKSTSLAFVTAKTAIEQHMSMLVHLTSGLKAYRVISSNFYKGKYLACTP
jgi:hypothetical protein